MRQILCVVVLFAAADRVAADMRCKPAAADLGEMRGGIPRQQHFTLVNDGAGTIEIVEVERGCGCLEVRLDRLTLPPGSQASMRVELRTSGQPNGPRSWNLRVRYREGEQMREQLVILGGTIRNEVTVEPSILALHLHTTLRQEIVVTDGRSRPLEVTALHTTSPAIRGRIDSSRNGVTKLVLEATAAALTKDREEALLNIYTDDPVYGVLQVPITLTRDATTTVVTVPRQVQVQLAPAHPVAAALVRLRRTDGKPAVITTAEADDPGVVCTWAAGPGNAATLKVHVNLRRLAERAGVRNVRVRLADETITVPVLIERER